MAANYLKENEINYHIMSMIWKVAQDLKQECHEKVKLELVSINMFLNYCI